MACNKQPKATDKANMEFRAPDSTYAILNYKKDWHWIFKDVQPSTLSETERSATEKIILRAIRENNERQIKALEGHNRKYPEHPRTATGFELQTEGYKRQYVPVINREGQKIVWINFFCNDWIDERWKSDIVDVEDGGNCYFSLKVNLDTGAYSELYINGYA
ncbi:hypothetical protein [Sinomicrobium oceani]|nr:hypothetical protein [Sinomicrobium oceani]